MVSDPYSGCPSPHSAGNSAMSVQTGLQAASHPYSYHQALPFHSQLNPTYSGVCASGGQFFGTWPTTQPRSLFAVRDQLDFSLLFGMRLQLIWPACSAYGGGPHYTQSNTSHHQTMHNLSRHTARKTTTHWCCSHSFDSCKPTLPTATTTATTTRI